MTSANLPDGPTGLNPLDIGVLSGLYDFGLLVSNNHAPTVRALDHIATSGLCTSEDAEQVIRRLASSWLLPLPLIDVHGNNGTMFQPPTQPLYTEVRLTTAGELAVQAARSEIAPLPIGLINGDIHRVLGVWPRQWNFRRERLPQGVEPAAVQLPALRPGFEPRGLIQALVRLLQDDALADGDIVDLVGAPLLLPFDDPGRSLEQLLTTGEQVLSLTPAPGPDGVEEMYPPTEVVLTLGAPLPDFLRTWIASSTTPQHPLVAEQLERLIPVK